MTKQRNRRSPKDGGVPGTVWFRFSGVLVLLGLFAASGWTEVASSYGAYDLYFVLDKYKIEEGLQRLHDIVPIGETYMHEGIEAASAQIRTQSISSSIIMALTDGKLVPYVHELTAKKAEEARSLGARVYCVGIKDFDEQQLADIADTWDQVFPVKDGFQTLKGIINSILKQSCTEILSVQPSSVCVNESFDIMLRGNGFILGRPSKALVCSFIVDQQTFSMCSC